MTLNPCPWTCLPQITAIRAWLCRHGVFNDIVLNRCKGEVMDLTRRNFVKAASATVAGLAAAPVFTGLGCSTVSKSVERAKHLDPKWTKQTTSICAFCSVGCGLLVNTDLATKRAVNVEGDPDHPINQGALCSKGAAHHPDDGEPQTDPDLPLPGTLWKRVYPQGLGLVQKTHCPPDQRFPG